MIELCEAVVSRPNKVMPLGFTPGDHYRFVPQRRIINMLLLYGFSEGGGLSHGEAREYLRRKIDFWITQGLAYRTGSDGDRYFDPIEVYNFFKLAGVSGRDDYLSAHVTPNHRRMVKHMAEIAPKGKCHMTLEYKRTFSLEGVAPGTKLRLRAPAPLRGGHLKEIETKMWSDVVTAEMRQGPGRLEMRMTAQGEPSAAIGARFTFAAVTPEQSEIGEIDRDLYLKEQEGLIGVTPKIRDKALTLAPRGTAPLEAIYAFWEFLHSELIFGAMHYDQIDMTRPSEWVMENGWVDCQTGGALLVSLCRAAGIPARLVCGYMLYPSSPVRHYWIEAWLEETGWTPFDLMSWDVSEGGRDIKWRDSFFGKTDYRLVLERMPHEFTGAIGLPLPASWVLMPQVEQGGVGSYFTDTNGKLVYSDFLQITVG